MGVLTFCSPCAPCAVVVRAIALLGCEFFLSYGMTECCGKISMSILPEQLEGLRCADAGRLWLGCCGGRARPCRVLLALAPLWHERGPSSCAPGSLRALRLPNAGAAMPARCCPPPHMQPRGAAGAGVQQRAALLPHGRACCGRGRRKPAARRPAGTQPPLRPCLHRQPVLCACQAGSRPRGAAARRWGRCGCAAPPPSAATTTALRPRQSLLPRAAGSRLGTWPPLSPAATSGGDGPPAAPDVRLPGGQPSRPAVPREPPAAPLPQGGRPQEGHAAGWRGECVQ